MQDQAKIARSKKRKDEKKVGQNKGAKTNGPNERITLSHAPNAETAVRLIAPTPPELRTLMATNRPCPQETAGTTIRHGPRSNWRTGGGTPNKEEEQQHGQTGGPLILLPPNGWKLHSSAADDIL